MQLDFKILFIDDDGFDGFMGSVKNALDAHLQNNGFVLNGIEIKNELELDTQIDKDKNYDMIFVDNRFDSKECGIDFIKKIRKAKIFADIVLCTIQSDNTLMESIKKDTALHGFYYIKKDNLIQHARNIIDFRLSKELDINVMRGIAMSEVSKFDLYIHQIILKDNSHKQNILSKIKDKAIERYNEITNSEMEEKIWEMVSNPEASTMYFESTMRKDFFHSSILKDIDSLKDSYNALKDLYGVNILKKRNDLAHKIDPKLTDDEIKQFRKDLIIFREIFKKINEHFNKTTKE